MPMDPARCPTLSLVRSRLFAALDARPRSLGLVVAPAGSGKTTLLAQYAASVPGPLAWLRTVPSDADPARMATRTDTALFHGVGGLLVVDDLHLIEGTPGESVLLDRALALMREGGRVLIGTRRAPPLVLARHEFSDSVIIDADQLRFRTWEVERLLRDVYREPLPADDVAALTRRLGGWAAGLKLYHLSTRGQPLPERRRAVASLAVRPALSRDYLTRTVLAEVAPPLRRFLIRTCVFEVLTAERCDRLLGGDGQAALEELERRQAFTVSHDGGRSFTYHEVLRAHLIAALAEELGETEARAWHARAGRLLAEEGAALEAARCFARAQQWAEVRRLVDSAGSAVAVRGLDPWFDLLPSWFIAEDPWLVLADARHRINEGQLAAAVPLLRRAEEMFGSEPVRLRCRSLRADVTAWLPGGPQRRGHWSGWLRTATRRHPMVVVGEAERLGGAEETLVRAVALLLAGHAVEASRVLDRSAPADAGLAGLACRLLRAAVALAGGDPAAPAVVAAVGLDADRAGLPWLARLARAVPALGGAEADLKEATAVMEECDRLGDGWGALLAAGCVTLAGVRRGGPEPDEATRLLDRARAVDSGVLAAWTHSLLALAAVRARLPDAEVEVRRAEDIARAAGVPGARVLALAAGVPVGAGRARARSAVYAAAEQAGLPRAVVAAWLTPEPRPSPSAPVTAPLTVRCLGGFQVCLHGEPLNWSPLRPRARAVARILAMHAGRAVHRDRLLDALWPDTDPATATRTLHVALSSLRRFLDTHLPAGEGETLLHRDGDAYLLALPEDAWCDVREFRRAWERASRRGAADPRVRDDLRVAVAAYAGELLPEDGPAEWVVAERETLRRQAADAAARLAEVALQRDGGAGAEPAVTMAARCVEIDPCHDAGWRLLIAAHTRAGNVAAAEHARRRYVDVLVSLGLDPAVVLGVPPAVPINADRRIPPPRSRPTAPDRARTSSGPPT